jgi:hypothetical protein
MMNDKELARIVDVASGVTYQELPEGYFIKLTEEVTSDEHEIVRAIVIEDVESGKFYRTLFRFNYYSQYGEPIGGVSDLQEVFPREVMTVVYERAQ